MTAFTHGHRLFYIWVWVCLALGLPVLAGPVPAGTLEKGPARPGHQDLPGPRNPGFSHKTAKTPDLTVKEREWISSHPVIKVAATEWPPFEYDNDAGRREGITYDILMLAASRVGLEVALVRDSWDKLLGRVKSGELDLAPGLIRTPRREEYLYFTTPFVTSSDAFFTRRDGPGIRTIEDLHGKTIAVEKGYYTQEMLGRDHPQIKLHVVDSTVAALKAVTLGMADAYLGTQAVGSYLMTRHVMTGLKVAAYFDANPLKVCMGVPRDKKILRDIMQKGLDTVTDREKQGILKAYISGGPAPDKKILLLTAGEKAWLKAHPDIRLGVDPSWLPFESMGSDGRYMGIVSEYVNWLNNTLGLSMAPVKGLDWQAVAAQAKTGGIDVLPGVGVTPSRKAYLNFTRPYLKIPIMLVTRQNMPFVSGIEDLSGKRFAVIENSPVGEKIKAEHPELNFLETPNLVEALQAVSAGRADATLGNKASLTYYMRRDNIKGLKVAAALPQALELSIGVRKDWPLLVSVLDKALAVVPAAEHRSFRDRWVNIQVESRIDWKIVLGISFIILLVAGGILAVILYANRRLAHEVRERTLAEQKMRAMSEAVHDAMVMIDAKARVMYWNHAAETMFGIPADRAMGCDLHALIAPQSVRGQAKKGLAAFAKNGRGPVVGNLQEIDAVRGSGRIFPVEVAVAAFKVKEDWHAVGTIRDITGRRQDEERIRKLSNAVEQSPVWVIITDTAGTIEYVNPMFTRITGYAAEKVIGKNPNVLSSGQTGQAVYEKMWGRILKGKSWSGNLLNRRKNGELFWAHLFIAPVRDPGGVVTHLIGLGEDITAQKTLQEERDEAYAVISGSINYAANIQQSILPSPDGMASLFSSYFVLWEPRDRVGGDIYFLKSWGLGKMLALGDCTGHGVPGAFMSMIANGALDMATLETPPGDSATLLQRIHQLIQQSLGQHRDDSKSDDGLDVGMCYIAPRNRKLVFSGARFSLFVVEGGNVEEIKGSKRYGAGYRATPHNVRFSNRDVAISPLRTFYMTSDGLIDQVGGPKRRGFGKKRFKALLLEMEAIPWDQRRRFLKNALKQYQGPERRRDDVSVIGFCF